MLPKIGDVVNCFSYKNGVVCKIETVDGGTRIWAQYSGGRLYTPASYFLNNGADCYIVKPKEFSKPGYKKLITLQQELSNGW